MKLCLMEEGFSLECLAIAMYRTHHLLASHIVEAQTAVEELRVLMDNDSLEGKKKNLVGCTCC